MRLAFLNTGIEFYNLDHSASLAWFLKIPLIINELQTFELAQKYYPQVESIYMPDLEYRLGEIAANYDALFECKFWATHLKQLFFDLYNKEMRLVYCPHGQSDKGMHVMAQYVSQDLVLLYGKAQLEMLQQLDIAIPPHAFIGNYRLAFYQKNQLFYDQMTQNEIFSKLNQKNKTLLYAPTWQDGAKSTSFFHYGRKVVEQLPAEWNLIVKVHPLLEQKKPAEYFGMIGALEKRENVVLVSEFPPVYPILTRCDAFLGDHSSVGYDFLYFQKPMFFFPSHIQARLHSCGTYVKPENLGQMLSQKIDKREEQKNLYNHAFDPFSMSAIRELLGAK